jgi:hypothetical protein
MWTRLHWNACTLYVGLGLKFCIIEQVVWNQSSLLLKVQKQNTETLQLFTEIIKTEQVFTNAIKMIG